ncbi:hypothetical protein ATCC90586_010756 [Pythium insidiosum]|nr:hypothetical protein ATCC90586_010756 [Pythium insidiosum]
MDTGDSDLALDVGSKNDDASSVSGSDVDFMGPVDDLGSGHTTDELTDVSQADFVSVVGDINLPPVINDNTRRTSRVFQYFGLAPTATEGWLCKLCIAAGVDLGSQSKWSSPNTTNLWRHLKSRHKAEYALSWPAHVTVLLSGSKYPTLGIVPLLYQSITLHVNTKVKEGEAELLRASDNSQSNHQAKLYVFDHDQHVKLLQRELSFEQEVDDWFVARGIPLDSGSRSVCEWFKASSVDFPRISLMARDYMAVPATSVPSEQAFSKAGCTINEKRARLGDDSVQAICELQSFIAFGTPSE